jgi:hypothetical protein
MLCRVVGRWATEVQEESKLQQRGAMMGKGVEDWTTGTNDGGRQAEMVEGRKCTEYSRSDMRHVRRRRRRRRRRRGRHWLGMSLEENSRSLSVWGVWKHSTVTAMADADQSRRDPGIPPAGGDRDFSKQPPPSQPVGSKPGPGVGRGLSRGPMADADGPNTKCPPLLGWNGARLAHENWSKRHVVALRRPYSPSAIRHSSSLFSTYCTSYWSCGPFRKFRTTRTLIVEWPVLFWLFWEPTLCKLRRPAPQFCSA